MKKTVIFGLFLALISMSLLSGCIESEMPEGYEYEREPPYGIIVSMILFIVWVIAAYIIGFFLAIKMFGLEWSWSNFIVSTFLGSLVGGAAGAGAGALLGRGAGQAIGGAAGFLTTMEAMSRLWNIPRSKAILIKIVSGVITFGLVLLGFFVLFAWTWFSLVGI